MRYLEMIAYLLVQTFKVIKIHLNSLSIHLWMPTIKFNVFSMTSRNNVMSICSTLPKMPSQQSCLGKDFFFKFHSFQSYRSFFSAKWNIQNKHFQFPCHMSVSDINYDLDRWQHKIIAFLCLSEYQSKEVQKLIVHIKPGRWFKIFLELRKWLKHK